MTVSLTPAMSAHILRKQAHALRLLCTQQRRLRRPGRTERNSRLRARAREPFWRIGVDSEPGGLS